MEIELKYLQTLHEIESEIVRVRVERGSLVQQECELGRQFKQLKRNKARVLGALALCRELKEQENGSNKNA